MANNIGDIQNSVLSKVADEKIPVTIYTTNGFQAKGTIESFDTYVVLLRDKENRVNLVYKHAISTIQPAVNVTL